MPDPMPTVLDWLSEATLAGLLAYILYGSSRRKWYWDHYVTELQARLDRSEKREKELLNMVFQLLTHSRTLVKTTEEAMKLPPIQEP